MSGFQKQKGEEEERKRFPIDYLSFSGAKNDVEYSRMLRRHLWHHRWIHERIDHQGVVEHAWKRERNRMSDGTNGNLAERWDCRGGGGHNHEDLDQIPLC